MKKRYLLFLFLIFLIPFNIKANGIDKFLMEVNVRDNGDIHVKELFRLNGTYNGFERVLNYYSPSSQFDGSIDSFRNSDIYNGSGLEIIKVKSIGVFGEYDFDTMNLTGTTFEEVSFASTGSSNVYTIKNKIYGKSVKIFNPSVNNKLFYIEYIVKNVVVVHNDIAELYYNVFSDEMIESIKELQVKINLPRNSEELLVWAHGPLYGEIDPIGKNQVFLKVSSLNANTPLDYRIVFDKELVSNSVKFSNVIGKAKILEVEEIRAEEANRQRETLKYWYNIANSIFILWAIILVKVLIDVYNKYDKEHQKTLHTKYFRDFPKEYGPELVSYLYDRKTEPKDLSASLLNLIAKKKIKYVQDKKEVTLTLVNEENLSESEKKLVDWFFKSIGLESVVTMSQINKASKKYESFLRNYNDWKSLVRQESEKEDFFEKKKVPAGYVLYAFLGVLLYLFVSAYFLLDPYYFLVVIVSIISGMYMILISKRTKKGHEEYEKWKGLENFLKDFGKFKERDLPHIELWEKYLVYAMAFGIADRLAKTMQVKFKELKEQSRINTFDLYYINNFSNLNNQLNRNVSGAVRSAMNTKAAQSRSSSGSGFGGGFSGGGGFGGGGGGGGRF